MSLTDSPDRTALYLVLFASSSSSLSLSSSLLVVAFRCVMRNSTHLARSRVEETTPPGPASTCMLFPLPSQPRVIHEAGKK